MQPENNYHPMPAALPRAVSLHTAATVTVAALGADVVLSVMDIVVLPWSAASVTQGVFDASVLVAAAVRLLELGARIATAAAFITWLFLARKNLDTWRIQGLDLGPGWAIGGWFVPILNFFIPFQFVRMVWRGTLTPLDEIDPPKAKPALIRFWWLTFLMASFGGALIANPRVGATAMFNAIVMILTIIAAVLGIVIVRRITIGQERRQAALDRRSQSTVSNGAVPPWPGTTPFDTVPVDTVLVDTAPVDTGTAPTPTG